MKYFKLFVLINIIFIATVNAQNMRAVDIAQGQLEAYNNQDIEAFLFCYSDSVEVFNFPNELVYKGKDAMRERYVNAWKLNPNQKAEVTSRISLNEKTVIDKEFVTGRTSGIDAKVIAIYTIENNKIQQVYFIRE